MLLQTEQDLEWNLACWENKWQRATKFVCLLLRAIMWVCRKLDYPCLSVSSYKSVSFPCVMLSGPQDKTSSGLWAYSPEQLGTQKDVIQPVKKRQKRCKHKMDKTVLSQSACSTAGVSLALWDSTVLRLKKITICTWQSRVEIEGHFVECTSITLLPWKCRITERAGLICAS